MSFTHHTIMDTKSKWLFFPSSAVTVSIQSSFHLKVLMTEERTTWREMKYSI